MAVSKEMIAVDRSDITDKTQLDGTPTRVLRAIEKRYLPKKLDAGFFDPEALQHELDQFDIDFDQALGTLWCTYRHVDRPCYTTKVLDQILYLQSKLGECTADPSVPGAAPRCLVWASGMRDVFNLGGDLELFLRLIRSRDEDGLRHYAYRCVDTVYNNLTNVGLPLLNITLIQGDALGGGFEAALSSDVIVAERQSKFGLPEVLFNLFPGMGAYSLLCRRLDGAKAKQMILSGRLYSAEEMHELGIVDVLAEPGEGRATVIRYIEQNKRRHRMLLALGDVRRRCQPVSYEELIDVTDLWVDTALNLPDADLRRMEHLAKAQRRRLRRLAT